MDMNDSRTNVSTYDFISMVQKYLLYIYSMYSIFIWELHIGFS